MDDVKEFILFLFKYKYFLCSTDYGPENWTLTVTTQNTFELVKLSLLSRCSVGECRDPEAPQSVYFGSKVKLHNIVTGTCNLTFIFYRLY
jgi:hypothetical protein